MGCLAAIIVFCVFAGNAILITGALSDDLADNPIAWIMVIGAIIGDFWLAGYGINRLSDSNAAKKTQELEGFKNRYELKSIKMAESKNYLNSASGSQFSEIGKQYKELCELNAELVQEINRIVNEQSAIFSQAVEYSDGINIRVFRSKEKQLQENKNKYTEKYRQLTSRKVRILPIENKKIYSELQRAMSSLASAGSLRNNAEFKDYYHFSGELPFFKFPDTPLIFNTTRFSYYVLPSVILKCHNNEFVSAYSPASLEVSLEEHTEQRYHYPKHEAIADDTDIIQLDAKRYSWLHTRMDGSPDLRYSYNPQTEYTVKEDHHKFAQLYITIAGEKNRFWVSSFTKAEQFKNAAEKYAATPATCDFARDLVLLLDKCDDNNDVRTMVELLSKEPDKNKICEIVGV